MCKPDSIKIMGPAAELEVVKPGTKDLGTVYYEVHSGFTNMTEVRAVQGAACRLIDIQHPVSPHMR